LRYDIGMLRRTARKGGHVAPLEHVAEAWSCAVRTGATALRRIGDVLSGQQAPEDRKALAQAVRGYRVAVDGMRRAGLTDALSTATVGRLLGIGFALEQFRRDLDDLVERSKEISTKRDRSAEAR
jgi:hypothetical protein